jgi:hypothetical protein
MGFTYKYKTKPYRHQVAALKKLLSTGFGGALLMEPRTGKTKVCVDYASIAHLAGKVNRVLVICPPGALMEVWVDEIRRHCPVRWRVTLWDREGRQEVPLPKFGTDVLDFVIVNYDAFATPGQILGKDEYGNIKRSRKKGGKYDLKRQLVAWQPQLMILDESHRIKSPSAARSRTIVSMAHTSSWEVPYRVIATGTAVTKKKRVFDLYMQWKFLNPDNKLVKDQTSASFKSRFGVWTHRNGYPQWLRNRNERTLHRLVHEDAFAVARDECFDLPPAFPPQIIHVALEESGPVYDAMAEDMVARLKNGEITAASIKLVQSLRLRQITSGITRTEPSDGHPEGRLVRIGKEKLRVLEELLSDWFEQDEKIVICGVFRADIAAIRNLCRDKFRVPTEVIVGQRGRNVGRERFEALERFRRTSGAGAFVINPGAASEGIDLRTASTMVWYSLTNSYVQYNQMSDRIALSPRAVRYVYLLGKGTYDEIQYEALQEDGDVVKSIMSSPERLLRGFK